jgi:hypothetical protein
MEPGRGATALKGFYFVHLAREIAPKGYGTANGANSDDTVFYTNPGSTGERDMAG